MGTWWGHDVFMFNDDIDTESAHHCDECSETFPDATFCPDCDEGRCGICGELIANGTEHATDGKGAVYCKPCDDLAAQESVVEIAEKLGAASDGVPVLLADDEAEETTPLPFYEPMAAVVNGRLR